MNNTVNMTGSEMQCVEGFRMMLQGMSLVFGTMAGSLGNSGINAPAEAGKPVTRKDVERAMGAKIKELARKGEGPDAIGAVFPKFHNAQCISDLDVTDYPAFLEELAKL